MDGQSMVMDMSLYGSLNIIGHNPTDVYTNILMYGKKLIKHVYYPALLSIIKIITDKTIILTTWRR